jgi:glycine oxidase
MATVDVTVMGAGVIGLSIAWACLQRGVRVQVIDPHGVASGASGGIVGALAPHVPEQWNAKKEFQRDSLPPASIPAMRAQAVCSRWSMPPL